MSDREDPPTDLFDAVCRLDDICEWMEDAGYHEETEMIRRASLALKGYIVISMPANSGGLGVD